MEMDVDVRAGGWGEDKKAPPRACARAVREEDGVK